MKRIVSGGSEVGSPRRVPAFRFHLSWPRTPVKVARRPARYDWGLWLFVVGWTAAMVTVAKLGGAL